MKGTGIQKAYGIDLRGDRAVVVRVSRAGRAVRSDVLWNGSHDVEDSEWQALLGDVSAEVELGHAVTVMAMPVRESIMRCLSTPFPAVRKARRVLPSLLDLQLPFSVDECVTRFLDVRREDDRVFALGLAVRESSLEERLDAYREAVLDPVVLDHEGVALWTQADRELPPVSSGGRVVCLVSSAEAVLVAGSGRHPAGAHHIHAGLKDGAEALADRIARVARPYLSSGGAPVEWIWAGDVNDGDLSAVEDRLGFGSQVTYRQAPEPAALLARGLAMRAVVDGLLRCDFRAGAWMHPIRRRLQGRKADRAAYGALAAGVLLLVLNGSWTFVQDRYEKSVEAERTQLARELSGATSVPYGQEVLTAERALESRRAVLAPFVDAFRPSLASLLGDVVKAAGRGKMHLETLTVRSGYISVSGTSEAWDDCQALAAFLREQGFVMEAPERKGAVAEERVHFSLKGTRPDA